MTPNNLEKLRNLFADCLELPIDQITPSLSQNQLPSWDSIATVTLVAELEEVFGVSFEVDEMLELTSLDRTINILREKGVEF
jgi:acyl carrier protein